MLTWEEDVEATALRKQGWTISAIARHLGRDRKTIRSYLTGERVPGARISSMPDRFEPYADYCAIRLADDPHLWASTLFEEVVGVGLSGVLPELDPGLCAGGGCARTASRAGPRSGATTRSSTIRRGWRPSSTGWSCPTRRGTGDGRGTRICWWGR